MERWKRIEVVQGDITTEQVDAVVNAANSSLLGGGGVDGAIHRVGGPAILAECRTLGGCPPGGAKMTNAGQLPAKHVIHTVGPVYRNGMHGEAEVLASCYRKSLEIASAHGLKSLAFPAISCGVYGYPIEDAAHIAIMTVADYLESHLEIERVRFVLFTPETFKAFTKALHAEQSAAHNCC